MFNISGRGLNIFNKNKNSSSAPAGDNWTLLLDIDYTDVNDYVTNNAPAGTTMQFAPANATGYLEKVFIYVHTGFSRPDPSKDFYVTSIDSATPTAITPLYTFNLNCKAAYPFRNDRNLYILETAGIKVTGANGVSDYFTFTGPDAPFPGDWTAGRVQIYGVIKEFPV